MILDQYPCPGCQNTIAAPFLYSRMEVRCHECGHLHAPPELPSAQKPNDWTPTGEAEASFGVSRSIVATQKLLFSLVALIGLAMAGAGLWMGIANPGQASAGFRWGVALGLIAFGGLIAWIGLKQLRSVTAQCRRMALRVYRDGFSIVGFRHSGVCRWDDFQAVMLAHPMISAHLNNNPLLVARCSGDAVLVDSALHANPDVVSAIQDGSLPYLLPGYLKAMAGGQRISFIDYVPAPLRDDPTPHVTAEGIEYADRKIPWSEVQGVEYRRANLTILPTQGKTISYNNPLTIPNVHVLVEIVRQLAGKPDNKASEVRG